MHNQQIGFNLSVFFVFMVPFLKGKKGTLLLSLCSLFGCLSVCLAGWLYLISRELGNSNFHKVCISVVAKTINTKNRYGTLCTLSLTRTCPVFLFVSIMHNFLNIGLKCSWSVNFLILLMTDSWTKYKLKSLAFHKELLLWISYLITILISSVT